MTETQKRALPSTGDAVASTSISKRRSYTIGTWVSAIATTLVALTGGLVVGYLYATQDAEAPPSCVEALEYADQLNVLSDEYADIAGEAVEAAGSLSADAMDETIARGEEFAPRYDEALSAYTAAATECRD